VTNAVRAVEEGMRAIAAACEQTIQVAASLLGIHLKDVHFA